MAKQYTKKPGLSSSEVAGRLYSDLGVVTNREMIGPFSDRLFGAHVREAENAPRRWSEEQYEMVRAVIKFATTHGIAPDRLVTALADWESLAELRRTVSVYLDPEEARLSA